MKRLTLLLLITAACSDESIDPARPSATVPAPDAGSEGGAPPVAPRVREVYLRNPFGGPFDNLMADGDFELSIVPAGSSGQYGWRAFSQQGEEAIPAETGGLCRSGLRCARVQGGTDLLGTGTAAAGLVPHRASIWVKSLATEPRTNAPCNLAEVRIITCDTFELKDQLEPAEAPDKSGWCQLSKEVNKSSAALCMYVQVGRDEVLIDNATLLAAPDLDPSPVPPAITPPAATRERMLRVRHIIRSRMPLGNPPEPAPGSPD